MFPIHIFISFSIILAVILPVYSEDSQNIELQLRNTNPIQCHSFTFSWRGGSAPFFVKLLGNDITIQRSLGPTNGSSLQWDPVDLAGGTSLQVHVSGLGSKSETSALSVQIGPTKNCLGSVPSSTTSPVVASPQPPVSPLHSTKTTSALDPSTPVPSTEENTSSAPLLEMSTPPNAPPGTSTPATHYYDATTTPSPSHPGDKDVSGSKTPQSLLTVTTSRDTSSSSVPHNTGNFSTFNPSASIVPQETPLSRHSKHPSIGVIVLGCLAAALLATLVFFLLHKRGRARERSRITSVTSLDTLAFTATTWSDLSPSEPGRPRGANKGVTDWNADLFASNRNRLLSRQNRSSWPRVPFSILRGPPFGKETKIASLSTIPEASADSRIPSPVESEDSESTASRIHSYPPLLPQTLPASNPQSQPSQNVCPTAAPPVVQMPVNPFRARLLAAGGGGGAPTGWKKPS